SATKSEFPVNSYIDNLDTYMLVLDFVIASSPGVNFSANFSLNIAFMADVQYDMDNEHLLTVSQPINQTSPEWTKVGYNANLTAQATKVEVRSMTTLKEMYTTRDQYGNTNNTHNIDDYTTAVVYKDIDVVNIDIATGEVIGKLSDVNYDFEWYGGAVTLPSGTTLASGRVLSQSETFTVDCYTYYPTMYLRRWMVGNIQYITLSDQFFPGSTKIDAYYTATFESTIFNPDYTIATNSLNNIIPRSYSYWWIPLTSGSVAHLQTYYDFKTYSNTNPSVDLTSASRVSTTQAQYLSWTNNLTQSWEDYASTHTNIANYINVQGVQGENYHAFVLPLIYLVKYANNNCQEIIGYGNTYSRTLYEPSGTTIITPNGTTITTGGDATLCAYESERGGGVIGLKGTAGNSAGEGITYNNANLTYGYSYSTPMYSQDFLTYSAGNKKTLLDGFVGSNKYTSVWLLGICNRWGNVWKWIFGTAVTYDESKSSAYAYINFETFDPDEENYITTNYTDDWEYKDSLLLLHNYSRLTYNLSTAYLRVRFMGVSLVDSRNGIQSLIGLSTTESLISESNDYGVTDLCAVTNVEMLTCGILYGGSSTNGKDAGIFSYASDANLAYVKQNFGFRSMLINK
ncbi:MAG: hypothetical protein IKC79_01365, partial [Clostridia bacterium]|nr:hypothetical protein [Clostridia bacterium]